MSVLGGFRVERHDGSAVSTWQRRSGKTVMKLLATSSEHALHREQIVELLWPGIALESALNSLGKALHAVRHALEPDLPPRGESAYLRTKDSMVSLAMDQVLVDADRFLRLADKALLAADIAACEEALAAYGGELLPEDRYADWCAGSRGFLAELRLKLLLELANGHEARLAYDRSVDCLHEILREEPAREEVHQRLMRLYVRMGMPDRVVRQLQRCEAALRRELDIAPQAETLELARQIPHDQISVQPGRSDVERPAKEQRGWVGPPEAESALGGPEAESAPGRPEAEAAPGREEAESAPGRAGSEAARGRAGSDAAAGGPEAEVAPGRPFVGRTHLIDDVCGALLDAKPSDEGMIVVSGEAGVGKTRFLEALAEEAERRGIAVLWGGTGAHATHFACGPFAVALESHAASRSEEERDELAHRYPALARFVPSLGAGRQLPPLATDPGDDHLGLQTEIVRLLSDLGSRQPVLVVLGDLHDVDPFSLDLVRYLDHLAASRPWLLIAAVRQEQLVAAPVLRRMLAEMMRERLCSNLELPCLSASECAELVRRLVSQPAIDRELLEHVYAQSRGNPSLILELVRELADGSGLTASEKLRGWGPSSNGTSLVSSLDVTPTHVDGSTRRVLELVAAAAVEAISLRDLRAAAGLLEPPVSDALLLETLDRGLELHLLEERGAGYGFRHPLVGTALYAQLPRHRREQLHDALSRATAGRELECSCGTCAVCAEGVAR